MDRAGHHPFKFADDPLAAFTTSLKFPRLEPTRDSMVADVGSRLAGWLRVDLEPGISRAVVTFGADPDLDVATLRPRLIRLAKDNALEAGVGILHVPISADDAADRRSVGLIGMQATRVYQAMEYHPVPAYLGANHRPVPDGYTVRTMAGNGDVKKLTDVQNQAFAGSWGYETNSVADIEFALNSPGTGPEWVRLVDDPEGETAAYIWTKFEPSDGMSVGRIGMVGVHPNHRRLGLGSVVTAAGIKLLRDAGAGVIGLEVDRDNKGARRVYRDLGFSRTGETIWYELDLSGG